MCIRSIVYSTKLHLLQGESIRFGVDDDFIFDKEGFSTKIIYLLTFSQIHRFSYSFSRIGQVSVSNHLGSPTAFS